MRRRPYGDSGCFKWYSQLHLQSCLRWSSGPGSLGPHLRAIQASATSTPGYFWGNGTFNSFPSHATLAYFAVAAGLWSLNRRLGLTLALLVLGLVSLPRIYLGGHYPIDEWQLRSYLRLLLSQLFPNGGCRAQSPSGWTGEDRVLQCVNFCS